MEVNLARPCFRIQEGSACSGDCDHRCRTVLARKITHSRIYPRAVSGQSREIDTPNPRRIRQGVWGKALIGIYPMFSGDRVYERNGQRLRLYLG